MGLPYLFQASKGEIERTKKIETKLTFIRSPCLGGPNEPSDFGHGLVQMVSESALVVQVEILVKPVHDLLRIAPKKIGRRCVGRMDPFVCSQICLGLGSLPAEELQDTCSGAPFHRGDRRARKWRIGSPSHSAN